MRGPSALQLLGATALLALLIGVLLARAGARWRARQRGRAHNTRGQRGERAAEALLARHGYLPIARQVRHSYQAELAGEPVTITLQADFLVEQRGRRLVAEVKTGEQAPRFKHADTRRQLLEYQLGFAVEAVLLIDVEAGVLQEVRFPWPAAPRAARGRPWLLAAAVAACALWFTRAAPGDCSALRPGMTGQARAIHGQVQPSR